MTGNDPNVVSIEDDGWWTVLVFVAPWLLAATVVWTVLWYQAFKDRDD